MPLKLLALAALLLAAAEISTAAPPAEKAAVHHQLPQLPQHHEKLQQQPQSPETTEAFFERCDKLGGLDWVRYNGACYRWIENPEYWEPAERACKALTAGRGHLVSIHSRGENGFVGKLTYCREAWIGRYAVDANRMTQSDNYRWTDGIVNNQYHAHNFTNAQLHYPLISTRDLSWFNNVYHQKHTYVCKVPTADRNYTCNCPTGWKELNGFCYFMPPFEATYIEGDFYCRGRDAYLASVHSQTELRAMSLLDVDTYGCPAETWLGLVKLNPCREDFATGTKVCYRWSDRSGDYNKIPEWSPNYPINDLQTNCVILKDREIRTVPCYTRARFVCKKKVGLKPCPST